MGELLRVSVRRDDPGNSCTLGIFRAVQQVAAEASKLVIIIVPGSYSSKEADGLQRKRDERKEHAAFHVAGIFALKAQKLGDLYMNSGRILRILIAQNDQFQPEVS